MLKSFAQINGTTRLKSPNGFQCYFADIFGSSVARLNRLMLSSLKSKVKLNGKKVLGDKAFYSARICQFVQEQGGASLNVFSCD